MGFYNISPDRLRDLQEPNAGNLLLRDGRNLTSVLAWIERNNPRVKERIEEYLGSIVSGVKRVDRKILGPKETLEFETDRRRQESVELLCAKTCRTARCGRLACLYHYSSASEGRLRRRFRWSESRNQRPLFILGRPVR